MLRRWQNGLAWAFTLKFLFLLPLIAFAGPADGPPARSGQQQPADQLPQETKTITLGTPRFRVESWLGTPPLVSLIPSLRRVRVYYQDSTQIIFVNQRVLSITPGADVELQEDGRLVLHEEDYDVLIDPAVLQECGDVPIGPGDKCQTEAEFFYAPSPVLPIYGRSQPFQAK